jgi:hypothetical protein
MMEPTFERAFWALAAADLALWQLDFPTERAMLDERWAQWVGLPAQKGEGITLTFAAWRVRVPYRLASSAQELDRARQRDE